MCLTINVVGRVFQYVQRKTVVVTYSANKNVTWNENSQNIEKSFVGFLHIFSDKTTTTLESSALVEYPLRAELLFFSNQFRRWLIQSGLTLIGFCPLCFSCSEIEEENGEHGSDELSVYEFSFSTLVPLSDSVRLTSKRTAREEKMIILLEYMTQC